MKTNMGTCCHLQFGLSHSQQLLTTMKKLKNGPSVGTTFAYRVLQLLMIKCYTPLLIITSKGRYGLFHLWINV